VAVTEWNWNGGWWALTPSDPLPPLDSLTAKGIGAAGYLHAIMRAGDVIEIACQSCLIGQTWDISAIRVSHDDSFPPYMSPSGVITTLYSKNYGEELLESEIINCPNYEQTLQIGGYNGIRPHSHVSMIDVLVTRDPLASKFFVHTINRSIDSSFELIVDLPNSMTVAGSDYTQILFEGPVKNATNGATGALIDNIIPKPHNKLF
jgi:hypothetical protein